ncbi:hypothetical protein YG5714_3036 [Sulfolobus islandicus Y.G.57.14]|uniref:Uncharacterized protein n=2 Tax=Saccharolobus islandicus TaxID=43080 RepID=C3NBJ5_SACI7|nr:hypothetical protein YG5714_3036 [Sulfolobus islandicus Y.G.57.14]ACP49419.1 hypothetical protein YN1551_3276 [Sulfolobus islandicus Y.N.15.51]
MSKRSFSVESDLGSNLIVAYGYSLKSEREAGLNPFSR